MNRHLLKWPLGWVKCMALLLLTGLAACAAEETVEAPPTPTDPPEIIRARTWAQQTLDSLDFEARVGQLVVAAVPELPDTNAQKVFAEWLNRHHIGGILLPDADRSDQARLTFALQSQTPLPLWVALEAGAAWEDRYAYPAPVALGAIPDDSLATDWGAAIGMEARTTGAHFAMLPIGRVGQKRAISEDPELVRRRGAKLIEGSYTAEVLPVPSAVQLPDSNWPAVDSFDQWRAHQGRPLEAWLQSDLRAFQVDATIFSELDTVPATLSHRLLTTSLRENLGYDGFLLSPPLDDSLWQQWDAAGARAIAAGVDLVVAPSDVPALVADVRQQIDAGHFTEAELEARVFRNLFQKALLGLDTLESISPDSTDLPDPGLELRTLTHRITWASVTELRDEPGRIPLERIGSTKIASLHIGTARRSPFQRALDHYTSLQHFILSPSPSQKQLATKVSQLSKFNYVLVGMGPEVSENDSLPDAVRNFLLELQGKTRLVVTNFGAPGNLAGLDSIGCVVQTYDDRPLTQATAGQFLFGAYFGGGKLPYSVGNFARGQGEIAGPCIRLAHTDPEGLGIDPQKLLKVDTLIRQAIYAGAFPGCQVLAARKGKVFLNKSYGWHDYNKRQSVRRDDVYDIASITKIAATTLMAMWSYDQDSLGLDLPLKSYLTHLDSSFITIKDITPAQLLIHKAGLPPSLPVYKYYTYVDSADTLKAIFYADQRDSIHDVRVTEELYFNSAYMDSIWNKVRQVKLIYSGKYKYSDLSMFLLKYLLEEIHQEPLDQFVRQRFYSPMGLQQIGFLPLKRFDEERIVPTENDRWWRHGQLRGFVHDQSTALLGGIGGQAGLFSNAEDLAVIMQMLLNGGTYGGIRYLRKGTVQKFTSRHPDSHRGLGFDMQKPRPVEGKGMVCSSAPATTFGHTGFTGTCTWVDPENEIVFVFLSNRIHPDAKNQAINRLRVRQNVQQAIYDALGLGRKNPENIILVSQPDSLELDSTVIAAEGDSVGCETC